MSTDDKKIGALEAAQEFTQKHVDEIFDRLQSLQDGQQRIELRLASMSELPSRVLHVEKELIRTSSRVATVEGRKECPNPGLCNEMKPRLEALELKLREAGETKAGVVGIWEFLKVVGAIVLGLGAFAASAVEVYRAMSH